MHHTTPSQPLIRCARGPRGMLVVSAALTALTVAAPLPFGQAVSATTGCPTPDATFSGSGTAGDPFLVTNAAHLAAIDTDLAAHYLQTDDIDLACLATPYVPIGMNTEFTGVYDGGGKTITNLLIDDSQNYNQALFAQTENATITDLTLSNVSISAYSYSAALIGQARYSTVSAITVIGATITTEGSDNGAVIGQGYAPVISDVTVSAATIVGTDNLGGVIGSAYGNSPTMPISITNVRSSTDVSFNPSSGTSSNYVGGLVGWLSTDDQDVTISQVAITGDISSTGDYNGGIIGYSSNAAGRTTTIESSSATGDVTGFTYTGGLVGGASVSGAFVVSNSYATGDVASDQNSSGKAGGLIGELYLYTFGSDIGTATLSASYAAGAVSGPSDVGGLVGYFNGGAATASASFWDVSTGPSGDALAPVTAGLTTTDLQTLTTFTGATPAWAIIDSSTPTVGMVWGHCDDQYPFLLWDPDNVPVACRTAAAGALPPPPPPQRAETIERIAGSDRYATAVELSRRFHTTASTVYLAAGERYADALVADPAAAADDAPILLVERDTIPAATALELQRLAPSQIVIVGGTAAISTSVEDFLRGSGAVVTRIAGADRYATAAELSRTSYPAGSSTVYVAVGTTFADALTTAPAAWADRAPVLLTGAEALPAATSAELARLRPSSIVIVGGTEAISATVEQQLAVFAPVTRIAGADRYATAAEMSRRTFPGLATTVFLASGLLHSDALGGAAQAARLGAPILLTRPDCIPAPVSVELDRLQPSSIIVLGGPEALAPGVLSLSPC